MPEVAAVEHDEAPVFASEVSLSFVDGDCELSLGVERIRMPAERYRDVVRGDASAATELGLRGFLVARADAAPGRAAPWRRDRGLPAQLAELRPYRPLGRGSFGSVYEAFDVARGIECAVKLCDQVDPESLLDFKNEVRTAWSLSHPNLVVPFQLRHERGLWFYAMELVRGRWIDEAFAAVAADERMDWLRQVIPQVVDALATLHGRGVLHLDLKPNNILIRDDRSVALLDFGLARWRGARPTGTRAVAAQAIGTPSFMAPELLLGREPWPASDWYSLGVLLFKLLSGTMPFADLGAMETTLRPLARPPTTLRRSSWVPESLARVCEGLLRPRPEQRDDGRALLAALGPRPSASTAPASAPSLFLGREDLLHALTEHHAAVATHGPTLVRVTGAPGVGKTALVTRFIASRAEDVVLTGRCYEHEHLPYKGLEGIMDELRQWLRTRAPAALRSRIQPLLPGPARLFPGFGELLAGDAAGAEASAVSERGAAYQQLKQLFAEVAECVPLVLWIDDVHWGDRDTAQLLVLLLSPPQAPRILTLCTHRGGEAAADSPFLAELADIEARGSPLRRVCLEVGPLDAGSLRTLAEHHAAGVEPELLARAVAEASGSPFLAEEFARYLAAYTGPPAQVPALADVVASRLRALADPERELVEMVAVAGRGLDERVVAAACRAGPAAASRALVSLKSRSLLRGGPPAASASVAVYHDRLRVEIVGLLATTRRDEYHRRLIGALGPNAAPHELFVHHRALDERSRAAELAVEAASLAATTMAFDRAAEWYREALELGASPAHDLSVRRAEALFNAGRSAAAGEEFAAAARAVEAPPLLLRAADAHLLAGNFTAGRELLRPLLRENGISLGGRALPVLGSILGQLVRLRLRGVDARAPSSPPDTRELAVIDACWSLGKTLAFVEPLTGVDFVLRSLRRSLVGGDPRRIARALAFLAAGVFFQVPGLRGMARTYLDRAAEIADTLDDRGLRAVVEMWSAMIEIGAGNWRAALDGVLAALAVLDGCVGVHWERMIAGGLAVWLMMHLGEIRRSLDFAARMLGDASERGDLYGQVQFIQYTAWDQILQGRTHEARRQVRWIVGTWSPEAYTVQSFYAMVIEALCDLYDGDPVAARERWLAGQPAFRRAGGLRAPQSRIDNAILEARVLLRQPSRGRPEQQRLAKLARELAAEVRSDGRVHGSWVDAAVCASAGRRAEAATRLTAAAAAYHEIGLRHWGHAAAAQARRLAATDLDADDAAHFAAAGIVAPERWLDTFMPLGVPDLPSPAS